MATLTLIRKKSVEALALDQLRAAIVGGTLPAGARLTEQDLSNRLGTSRATIRSALHHLVAEGLVAQVPYTGWTVASLSARDARELVSLRASLECLAADLAAGAGDDEARARFAARFDDLVAVAEAHDSVAASAADAAFHHAMVELSGHDRLAQHYRLVAQQIRVLIASSNALLSDAAALVGQHRPIYDAIMAGNAEAAAVAVRTHIDAEGRKLVALLDAREAREAETAAPERTKKRKAVP